MSSQPSLDELSQRYIDAVEAEEEARFTQSAIAWAAREMSGKAALNHLASQAHRKAYRLSAQADTFDLIKLRETRPVLTWLHLNILATASPALLKNTPDAEAWNVLTAWADKIVDNEWTPADLRREIGKAVGGPVDDPSVIVKKAESSTEKLRKVIDEAVQAHVILPVVERVEATAKYAAARLKEVAQP